MALMRLLEQHYDSLFGESLPRAEFGKTVLCADITAAATDFFMSNVHDHWDVRQQLGSVLAAAPVSWYEMVVPTHLRTETGVQRLLPADLAPNQVRFGYHWTQTALTPALAACVLAEDPLPALVAVFTGAVFTGPSAERKQALDQWRRSGVAVTTVAYCNFVTTSPGNPLTSGLFGLYLDRNGQPLPELMAAAVPPFLAVVLGGQSFSALYPLFYALSALNTGQAYLQVAPTAPGVSQPLPFTELVLRTPHVPVTYPN